MMELALRSGIALREWERATDTEIATAITILREWDTRRG